MVPGSPQKTHGRGPRTTGDDRRGQSVVSGAGNNRGNQPNGRSGVAKKHNLKGKKRVRGFKPKARQLVPIGEAPDEKRLKGGRVRKFNLLPRDSEDAVPRKTQRLFERVGNQVSNQSLTSAPVGPSHEATLKNEGSADNMSNHNSRSSAGANTRTPKTVSKKHEEVKGLQPGESIKQLSHRLRTERRKLVYDEVRKTTHQWEKKKAHYEKRRKRLEVRKKRRRGQVVEEDSDGDGGNDTDEETRQNLSRLPMYWQEIVRNNGRPVSEKKRRRLHRLEMQELRERGEEGDVDNVKFGEQAERPPDLGVVPKQREGHGSKRKVV